MAKIMQVFYGTDLLPYKDKERSVHYPVSGSSFLGASNTTEIRFYIEQIGSIEDTWVANSKLPNGKMGNQILEKGYDNDIKENYVYLKLTTFHTQAKGDLYISLNGFFGGVAITKDDEDIYHIDGIPTIQATGSVKIAIYYATPLISGDEVDTITLQQLLSMFGNKEDRYSPNNYRGYKSKQEAQEDIEYMADYQMFSYMVEEDGQTFERFAYCYNGNIIDISIYGAGTDRLGRDIVLTYATKEEVQIADSLLGISINNVRTDLGNAIGLKLDKPSGAVQPNKYIGTDEYGQVVYKEVSTENVIDDNQTSTTKTWSSSKIVEEHNLIRAVAEGKTKSYVLNMQTTIAFLKSAIERQETRCVDSQNNDISQQILNGDFDDVVYDMGIFNSQDEFVQMSQNKYYIFRANIDGYTYLLDKGSNLGNLFKLGDIVLITQTNVPDRWFGGVTGQLIEFRKLETAKIDLNDYYTKGEVEAIKQALQDQIDDIIFAVETEETETINGVVVPKLTAHNVIDIHNALINGSVAKVNTDMVISSSENDSGDIIVNLAIDENTIVKYTALNGHTSEEDYATISVVQSMHYKKLTYDGTNIKDGDTTLTFNDIKALIENQTDYVYVDDTYHLAVLTFQAYENDAIWFNTRYKISGENHFVRLIINAQNQIEFDDDIGVMLDSSGKVPSSLLPDVSGFNVINASDMRQTAGLNKYQLTSEQYDVITNGKPTLIKGTLIFGQTDITLSTGSNWGTIQYRGIAFYFFGSASRIGSYAIDLATKTLIFSGRIMYLEDVHYFNSKQIPDYPTNPTTPKVLTYDTDNALKWADSNTTHIINVNASTSAGTYRCQFSFNAPSTTTFTTTGTIASHIYDKSPTLRLPASGTYVSNGVKYIITGISTQLNGSQKELVFEMVKLSDGSDYTISSYGLEIVDTII